MTKIKFTNDTISDVLTRIRNNVLAKKDTVTLPNIKIVLELLKVLSNNNFVDSYTITEEGELSVSLKVAGKYRFSQIDRVSKPGIRKYVGSKDLRPVKGGRGISIISTSKGVMSGDEAKKEGVGGEYLCKIW